MSIRIPRFTLRLDKVFAMQKAEREGVQPPLADRNAPRGLPGDGGSAVRATGGAAEATDLPF